MSTPWIQHETGQNQDCTYLWKTSKRALRGHLHHKFSPPAVVLVCHLLQTLDHLSEGGDHVEALPWPQERTHCLEIQHWGIENDELVSVRNKPHAKEVNRGHWIIYIMHMQAISSLSTTQFRTSVNFVWRSPVNCKCVWINHRPMSLKRAPCICLSMWNKWNLWIYGTVLEKTVWADCLSAANLFTRERCALVWAGCIRYVFPLVLIAIAHSALLLTGYEFISKEIQCLLLVKAKPLSPNASFRAEQGTLSFTAFITTSIFIWIFTLLIDTST